MTKHTLPRLLPNGKPYDIRARLELFAGDVVALANKLHLAGGIAGALSAQLAQAATSAAANAEEADDGSSRRDFNAKELISLRELKETRARLKVLRRAGLLPADAESLIQEAAELVLIVSTIARNASKNRRDQR